MPWYADNVQGAWKSGGSRQLEDCKQQVGRYYIDLLWNLAPQDSPPPEIQVSSTMGKEFLCTATGTTNRVYNVSECLGKLLAALKPGQASKADASDQSNPVLSIRNKMSGWSVPPSLLLLPAATPFTPHAVAQANLFATLPPKMLVGITQFRTHLLYDTLYIKFLFLWLEQPSPPVVIGCCGGGMRCRFGHAPHMPTRKYNP